MTADALRRRRNRERRSQPLVVAPPPQLAQHATVRQRGHMMFERHTRAQHLHATGAITMPELLACERYERACVRAGGCLATDERRSGRNLSPEGGVVQGQLDAASDVAAVRAGIGAVAAELLRLGVVEDVTWAALARHCGHSQDTARRWTLAAIADLTAWYEARDNLSVARK